MNIRHRFQGSTAIVEVSGKLDTTTAAAFDAHLRGLPAAQARHGVVVLSGLDYISSAGLRSILVAAKLFASRQGRLVLTGLSGTVQEVFALSGFDRVVHVCASEAQALAELDAAG